MRDHTCHYALTGLQHHQQTGCALLGSDESEDSADYEYVDGPAHYHGTECIEKMRKLYGDDAVRWFCICNAYKYRFRNGSKPGVTAEQDEEKARWYENYAANMMGEQRYY